VLPNIVTATSSVKTIPISVCARRAATNSAIKSMYPKLIAWEDMPGIMTDIPWSPSHFANNHRAAANLLAVQTIAFDFDSGLCELDQMVDYMKDAELSVVIGTTKSHQIEKGDKPPCDRFRVAILMESIIADNDLYRQQMNFFKELWSTNGKCWFDNACVDSSRFFYPCKNIVYINHGSPLPWVEKKVIVRQARKITEDQKRNTALIPRWVFERLSAPSDKSRHTIAYSVSACLTELGWELEEIVEVVMATYIAAIGEEDVREACWYGAGKITGEKDRAKAIAFIRGNGGV